jgi:hypothetical protein
MPRKGLSWQEAADDAKGESNQAVGKTSVTGCLLNFFFVAGVHGYLLFSSTISFDTIKFELESFQFKVQKWRLLER